MKSYILKLLAQSDSEAAKMLTELINTCDIEYKGSPNDCFTSFVMQTLPETELFQFCRKYSNKGKQVVEETPVYWCVRDNNFVSLWLE